MEPRIQYAKTSDGVSIAFWALGEGSPLVHLPWHPISHIQLEWEDPDWRRWYDRLLRKRQLVRYDGRGTGLSQCEVTDYSLDALVLDLEAVVDRLGLGTFAVLALHHAGFVAIAYAARHPERVSHLILWCSYARGRDWWSPDSEAFLPLLNNWERFAYAKAHDRIGWSEGDSARRYAAILQTSQTPEGWKASMAAVRDFDVSALLPEVKSPTLILHRRGVPFPSVNLTQGLASQIPDAQLVLLEGDSRAPYLEEMEPVVRAIDSFLGVEVEPAAQPQTPGAGAIHTILFTDIEGSTALTQRLGDAKARQLLREHERITREALRAHGGSEVKTLGDGFMASFGSATGALECAIAIQRAFEEWNRDVGAHGRAPLPPVEPPAERRPPAHPSRASGRAGGGVGSASEPLRVRIGLNAGEPIAEADDLFGTAVITAARIAAHAQGGEILVSDVVRQLVAGKGFLFGDRGEAALRGFDDPVRVFEVRWREPDA